MSNEEILKKAIERAIENGFKTTADIDYVVKSIFDSPYPEVFYNGMIIDHDFAEAFWGKERVEKISGQSKKDYLKYFNDKNYGEFYWLNSERQEAWIYHLQQMVLEKEPLKYLKKFL